MQNLIPRPRSTHVSYFRWTLLYKKCEIHEKNVIAITFFHVFHIFRIEGSIESMQHCYSLDEESNYVSEKCFRSKFE